MLQYAQKAQVMVCGDSGGVNRSRILRRNMTIYCP